MDFKALFPEVSFGKDVQVLGIKNIQIGSGTCIGARTWLNVCNRDDSVRMYIGARSLVGRDSMISVGGRLEIGEFCLFAPRVYISDADHVYDNIMVPYAEQGATAGQVILEENCWLGINTSISGNLTIGRGSVIGANSVVTKDIPPFSVAVGSPAKVIKIFDFKRTQWVKVRDEIHYRELMVERESQMIPSREVYLKILQKKSTLTAFDPVLSGDGHIM